MAEQTTTTTTTTEPTTAQQTTSATVDYDKIQKMLDGTLAAKEDTALKAYFKQQGLSQEEAEQAAFCIQAAESSQSAGCWSAATAGAGSPESGAGCTDSGSCYHGGCITWN